MQSLRGRISGDEEWKALRGETGKTAGTGCAVPPTATVSDTATGTATAATAATSASTVSVLASSIAPGAAKESDINKEGGSNTLRRVDIPFFDDDDDDDDSRGEGITDKIESRETVSQSDSDNTKPSGTQITNNLGDKHTEKVRGTDRVTLKFITLGGERAVGGVPFDSTQYLWSAVETLAAPIVSDRGMSGEQGRGDGVDRGKDTQLPSTSSSTSATTSMPSSSTSSSADISIEAAVARITSIQQVEDKRFHRSSSSSAASSSRPAIATHAESVSPSAASVWQNMRVSEITIFTGDRSL
jgi:hypothetical protein